MQTLFNAVHCLACGYDMAADLYATKCEACGNPWLDARYDLAVLPANWPKTVAKRPLNLWRCAELLPFPPGFPFVSMGEGWTPLTRAEGLERETGYDRQGGEIWIKDERQNPTGSLKDRQAAFTISTIRARGIAEMVLASTGNAAAGYAAYCARAGIKLWVFLPSSVPAEKMRELALYGAEVVKVTGTYDQAKEIAADFAARRGLYLDQGAKAIPGKESMKTIAFEIAEQFGWRAPDWYIQAVSGGIGPLGVMKGFIELHEAGLIERVPKLGIVQVEGCAPMVRAWERGLAQAEPVQPDTLVTVLATGKPGLAYDVLKQMTDRFGGAMVAVSDGDAFRAMRRVARTEGLSMEPAASVAFAGLEKLLAAGHIRPGERVLVNCSGHTFSAEKHALEDRYVFQLQVGVPLPTQRAPEGLAMTLEQLDEQITSIVVIDDNPNDSRLIRRLLQTYKQYRVFEAHNALDGLDQGVQDPGQGRLESVPRRQAGEARRLFLELLDGPVDALAKQLDRRPFLVEVVRQVAPFAHRPVDGRVLPGPGDEGQPEGLEEVCRQDDAPAGDLDEEGPGDVDDHPGQPPGKVRRPHRLVLVVVTVRDLDLTDVPDVQEAIDLGEQADLDAPVGRDRDVSQDAREGRHLPGQGIPKVTHVFQEVQGPEDLPEGPHEGKVEQADDPPVELVPIPNVEPLGELKPQDDDGVQETSEKGPVVGQDVGVVKSQDGDLALPEGVAQGRPDGPALAPGPQGEDGLDGLDVRLETGAVIPDDDPPGPQDVGDGPDGRLELGDVGSVQADVNPLDVAGSRQDFQDVSHRRRLKVRIQAGDQDPDGLPPGRRREPLLQSGPDVGPDQRQGRHVVLPKVPHGTS